MSEVPPHEASDDGSRRIEFDLPCLRCGYNLRTLRVGGVCPECSAGVAFSFEVAPSAAAVESVRLLRKSAFAAGALLPAAALVSIGTALIAGAQAAFVVLAIGAILTAERAFVAGIRLSRALQNRLPETAIPALVCGAAAVLIALSWLPDFTRWSATAKTFIVIAVGLVLVGLLVATVSVAELCARYGRSFGWHEVSGAGNAALVCAWVGVVIDILCLLTGELEAGAICSIFALALLGGTLYSTALLLLARRLKVYRCSNERGDEGST